MNLTTQRRFLTALAVGFLAVAAGGVAWSLGSIESDPAPPPATLDRRPTAIVPDSDLTPASETGDTTLGKLTLPLLQPLYTAPKPAPPKPQPQPAVVRKPTPPVAKKPRLDWTLAGTIIDSQRSVAILTDATGKTDVRAVGEEVDLSPAGVLVRKIDSDQVTLDVNGKPSTLQLKQSFGGGGGGSVDRQNRRRNR